MGALLNLFSIGGVIMSIFNKKLFNLKKNKVTPSKVLIPQKEEMLFNGVNMDINKIESNIRKEAATVLWRVVLFIVYYVALILVGIGLFFAAFV